MSSTVKLRIGTMNASGVLEAGSMARAIEDALAAQVPYGPDEDPHGRRRLALAIAQGVVEHLHANPGAIMTRVRNNTGTGTHLQPADSVDRW
jgi:hypothetical protein